jgi:hypothetical protein
LPHPTLSSHLPMALKFLRQQESQRLFSLAEAFAMKKLLQQLPRQA